MVSAGPYLRSTQIERLAEIISANDLMSETLYLWPMLQSAAPQIGWYGGSPVLPNSIDWPVSPLSDEPVHFLFQIDLTRLPACHHPHRGMLPDGGVLMVFGGLTWPYVEGSQGVVDGLAYVIYAPDATLDDDGRAIPPGMTSPFDEDMGIAELREGFSSPDSYQLPKVPLRACAVPELRQCKGISLFREDQELAEAYDDLKRTLDNSAFAESCIDITRDRNGFKSGLNPYHAMKMFRSVRSHTNVAEDPGGVLLFSMAWPPASGVELGDPSVDLRIDETALAIGDFRTMRAILEAT